MTAPTRRRVLPVAPRLAGREQAERAGRRRRRLRRLALAALVAVPLCLVCWLLLASPVLAVSRVEVSGVSAVSAADVRAAAAVPAGTPLARVDLGRVRRSVGRLGPVERVRVARAWPHTLRVRVTERTPVATVAQDGGWALVDASGVRFSVSADRPAGLPALGDGQEERVQAAVQVLSALPPDLRSQVQSVQEPSASSVVLQLAGSRSVVWGPPGQDARKAAVVAALLRRPGTVLDVTTPDLAVVR